MSILKADKILRPDGETLLDTTGSVLQTQSTHITAYASTTSSSYVTLASYQVSITLSHADNKVLVMGGWYGATSGSYNRSEYAMYRGSQIINIGDSNSSAGNSSPSTCCTTPPGAAEEKDGGQKTALIEKKKQALVQQ